MSSPAPNDPTIHVGIATDVAPLGRSEPKPAHERTAAEEPDLVDWDRMIAQENFKALLRAKARFIAPASIFFVVYYFALPVLVGYAPKLMATPVIGPVNLAYLFALSQFFMAWTLAAMYVRAAAKWDRMSQEILAEKFKR